MSSRTSSPQPFPSSLCEEFCILACSLFTCSRREKFNKECIGKTLKSIHNHTELTGIWQIQVDISIFVICIRFMKGKLNILNMFQMTWPG